MRTEQVGPVPHQLPAHTPHFVGRADEIRQLSDVVDTVDDGVAIVTIGGPAGIGKKALAVRWAHHVADRFPDGQLYDNLRGFDPTGTLFLRFVLLAQVVTVLVLTFRGHHGPGSAGR